MLEFLWDLSQQRQISEARSDAAQAKGESTRHAERLRDLEFSVQRLSLVSQALWELLRSRLALTEEELLAAVEVVDLRDGKRDGQMSPQATACPDCARTVGSRYARCVYCGSDVHKSHMFQ